VLPDTRLLEQGARLLPDNGPFTSTETIQGAISAGMLDVRQGVVSDLKSAPRERQALAEWLTEITSQYRKWYLRFTDLTND
jgi:hypothetical protein